MVVYKKLSLDAAVHNYIKSTKGRHLLFLYFRMPTYKY